MRKLLTAFAFLALAAGQALAQTAQLPLNLNLGGTPNDRSGSPVRTLFQQTQAGVNALANARGAANGIATLDANGKVPLGQIPATVTNTLAAPGNFIVGGQLSVGGAMSVVLPTAGSIANKFPGSFIFAGNNNNAIVGSVLSNRPLGVATFDTAVTGYGQLAAGSNGNTVFGLFGRADMYAPGIGTNEVNSFNFTGQDGPTSYPFNRTFGTTQSLAIALTVAAGGPNKSAAGIELAQEGEIPSYFQYGLVMRKEVNALYNIYLDADANSSPLNGIYSATRGNGINLTLVTTTAATPKTRVLSVKNFGFGEVAAITNDGTGFFGALNLTQKTPASSTATCATGDINVDSSAIYVCVSPSSWRRVLYSTF